MKLLISIPIYFSDPLHIDFTWQTINSIQTKHNYQILVVNNYCHPDFKPALTEIASNPKVTVLENPTGNNLAISWNMGLKQASQDNYDAALTINNDILFHDQAIDNLIDFAAKHPEFVLWTGTEWADMRTLAKATWDGSHGENPHFSCFLTSQATIDQIGYFDEKLQGAYFEDNDYHTRILLAGKKAAATTTSKFYHYGSRTANIDEDLRRVNKQNYQTNRKYMKRKWGLDFHGQGFNPPEDILKEIYKTPFNK